MPAKKEDLLKQLPPSPEAQKQVKNNVREIVDSMLRIQSENDLIAEIKAVCKEKHSVCPAWLKLQATIMYDRLYNENKNNNKVLEKAEEVEMNSETFQ